MRKVKFPLQLDIMDIATAELREQLGPVNAAVKQILKSRDDRAKIAKRVKGKTAPTEEKSEETHRSEEREQIKSLMADMGTVEPGTNTSGMYELCGRFRYVAYLIKAMVTHKGPSAEAGHYIGWVRKDGDFAPSGEEEWYKFDGED